MAGNIVFEDAEIRVVHRPGSSDYSLVTFAALGHRPNGDWIWAGPPIEKLDIEAIGIIAHRPNWFPAAAMQAAAPVIRDLLRPRAIGYGYSMGGYAVLKYGRLLGLTHGLAVSPQVSIDPADVPQERRFRPHHDPVLHANMAVVAPDPPPISFVVGDTMWDLDGLHLRQAATLPGVHVIPLPFMRHAAIDRLTSTRVIASVLDLVLAGDAAALREELRRGRSQSAELHLWIGRSAAARGHLGPAERLWARAQALGARPGGIAAVRALALRERLMALFAMRRPREAIAFINTAIEGQGRQVQALVHLGEYLRRRGLPARAAQCFRRAIQTAPRFAPAHLGLLQALQARAGPREIALARSAALENLSHSQADVAAVLALDIDLPAPTESVPIPGQ